MAVKRQHWSKNSKSGFIGIQLVELVIVELHSNYWSNFPNVMTGIFEKHTVHAVMVMAGYAMIKSLEKYEHSLQDTKT